MVIIMKTNRKTKSSKRPVDQTMANERPRNIHLNSQHKNNSVNLQTMSDTEGEKKEEEKTQATGE